MQHCRNRRIRIDDDKHIQLAPSRSSFPSGGSASWVRDPKEPWRGPCRVVHVVRVFKNTVDPARHRNTCEVLQATCPCHPRLWSSRTGLSTNLHLLPKRVPNAPKHQRTGHSSPAVCGDRTPRSVAPCTLSWPRKMFVPPPDVPMLPRAKLKHAISARVVVAVGVLRATHAPNHSARTVVRHRARNALELRTRCASDALDFFRCPLGHFFLNLVHAPNAGADELFVLPTVVKDVPQDAPNQRDVCTGTEAYIFISMCGRACESADRKQSQGRCSALLLSSR